MACCVHYKKRASGRLYSAHDKAFLILTLIGAVEKMQKLGTSLELS